MKTEGPIVFVLMLSFLSFFGGSIGPSVFTLIHFLDVHLSVCPFFRIFGYSLISHELLDKTYINRMLKLYVHYNSNIIGLFTVANLS